MVVVYVNFVLLGEKFILKFGFKIIFDKIRNSF